MGIINNLKSQSNENKGLCLHIKASSEEKNIRKVFKRASIIILTIMMVLNRAQTLSPYVFYPQGDQNIRRVFNIMLSSVQAVKNASNNKSIESPDTNEPSELPESFIPRMTNDPLLSEQWGIHFTDSLKAWQQVEQKRQVRVAVVDTGVDYNHPDLKNRVLVEEGYNFFNGNSDPMDDSWHGTHIAGIIAAEANNGIGISGVAGELDVKIIPIKVLGEDGRGPSTIIAEGIRYAVDKKADVINISITFSTRDKYIEDAIKYARENGVFVVAASGNDSKNCDSYSPQADSGTFTVASINSLYERSYFSNYGKTVAVSAPGSGILSTVPGGSYEYRNGTSMAAPIVAGIAAILKADNPELTPEQLSKIITESSVQGKIIAEEPMGKGVANAYEALRKSHRVTN